LQVLWRILNSVILLVKDVCCRIASGGGGGGGGGSGSLIQISTLVGGRIDFESIYRFNIQYIVVQFALGCSFKASTGAFDIFNAIPRFN
jgi:hypothetical protein